jgi:hypothetical protein
VVGLGGRLFAFVGRDGGAVEGRARHFGPAAGLLGIACRPVLVLVEALRGWRALDQARDDRESAQRFDHGEPAHCVERKRSALMR